MDDDVSCGAPAWLPSLDGLRMRAIGTGDTGQVDGNTLFVFSQHGNTISARYSGGAVDLGYLVGRVTADRLVFRYCQVDLRGDVHGGRSACRVGRLPDGRLRLQEHFTGSPAKAAAPTCCRRWRGELQPRGCHAREPRRHPIGRGATPGGSRPGRAASAGRHLRLLGASVLVDNSGFIGWLAGHLKTVLGTGVLVVCGFNRRRGGVFDYWCVPERVGEAAIAEVHRLRASGR